MSLDPDAQRVLDQLRRQYSSGDGAVPALPDIRAGYEQVRLFAGPSPDVYTEDLTVTAVGGAPVPVRLHRPVDADGPLPVALLLHSGWFTIGSIDTVDAPARVLADQTPALLVSVGYRLAPEHPFPAGLDDCVTVLRWALEHAADHGGDPTRVVVVGESAGGALAAGTALAARDAGLALRGQILVYPNADSALDSASWQLYDGWVIDRASGRQFLDGYAPMNEPRAYPLHADLAGVAPAAVLTMEYDPLRDEGEALADRLRDAGVLVAATRCPGLMHGALLMRGAIPAVQVVFDAVANHITTLAGSATPDATTGRLA